MLNNIIEYAKNENIDLEVNATKNDEISIEYLNQKLVNYKLQDIKEYKLKAIIDGLTVTSTVLDISNPEEIIRNLKLVRDLTDEVDKGDLAESIDIDISERKNLEIDINEVKNNIKTFNQEIKEKYQEVYSVRTEFNFEKDIYELTNTNNVYLKDINYHGYYYTDITLKIDDKTLSCSKFLMQKTPDFAEFKNKAIKEIEMKLQGSKAKSLKTQKYNIILENKSVYDILNAFVLDFHISNLIKKQSAFTNKINTKIFSDKITIVEDPTNWDLIGTRLFDSEGVKTYYKEIVGKGVFKTILYNKKYAAKDFVNSTGNAYGVRNVYIKPGKKDFNELLSVLNDGIYVRNLQGVHSGINHLTGDISLQCEGFVVESGKITRPLNQIILSTNIFELFSNVKEIGNDLEFFSSNGGAPSLLIENITIAGKEV